MSFPRYPAYKDSGVEWLGEVPGHWEVKRIKTLTDRIASGKTPLGGSEVYVDEGITFLRSQNVYDEGLRLDDVAFISEAVDETMAVSRVAGGDILLNITGASIGRSCVVPDNFSPANVNQHVCVIRATKPSHVPFLGWSLKSAPIKSQIDHAQNGAAREGLNFDQIGRMVTVLPTELERSQIAAFLDRETAKIDELVAEQRRLMALLKEKRQAVISHAVTRGLNPHAPMKPSGIEWLGDVPEHWEVIALKRIADVQTGVAKGKDNGTRNTITVPYLRVANVQDGYLDLETVATMDIPAGDLPRYALQSGDVLMNEGGDFDKLGRGHVWDGQIDPCITQNHVFAVRPRKVASAWLNAITGSDFAQFYFMTRSKQSTNLASISSTNLMELPVILPTEKEQHAILAFIAAQTAKFDTLTTETQCAIDLLQERRTALISAAVTGQIDVRGAVVT